MCQSVEVRVGMCVKCGRLFNMKTLEQVKTPHMVQSIRRDGDPVWCGACQKMMSSVSSWDVAFDFTSGYEGGYVNDPNDMGGETFKGISRVSHSKWPGWEIVDRMKLMDGFPGCAERDHVLSGMVKAFYRIEFWDEVHGDELPWKMAVAVFDFAIHSSPKKATRYMQNVLGVVVDGIIGQKTVKAAHDQGEEAVVELLMARTEFLHKIMVAKPSQRVWARNWFRRMFKLANVVLEG